MGNEAKLQYHDFYWLQFQKGGTGIFALTAAQCRTFRDLFIQSLQVQ